MIRTPTRWAAVALLLLVTAGARPPEPSGGEGVWDAAPRLAGEVRAPMEPDSAPGPEELRRELDAYVRPLVEVGDLSGTLLVARGGRIVYERSFGMADYELGVPNGPDTRFNVASVTKPLTRIAALLLAEAGDLTLDDPLSRWIPDFPRGGAITIRHLVEHRSGIPHRVTTDTEVFRPYTAAEMVEKAAQAGLDFEPGSRESYSSAGYSVLARVLELAAGESYADLLDRLVLQTAGAVQTRSPEGWTLVARRADAYRRGGSELIRAEPANLTFLVGAGSLYSTPRDLLRVLRTIVDGGYGSAVRRDLMEDGRIRWNGITYGYRAFVDYRAIDGVTVLFAGNLHTGAVDLLRSAVPRIAAGEEVEPPDPPRYRASPPAAEDRRAVEGIYQLRPGAPDSEETLRFSADGERASLGGWILVPTADDAFLSPQDYARVEIVRQEEGGVTGLRWQTADGFVVFPKVAPLPR